MDDDTTADRSDDHEERDRKRIDRLGEWPFPGDLEGAVKWAKFVAYIRLTDEQRAARRGIPVEQHRRELDEAIAAGDRWLAAWRCARVRSARRRLLITQHHLRRLHD